MSDLEIKPIHNFFEQQSHPFNILRIHEYNKSPKTITFYLGLLRYCETNATVYPTEERAIRKNYILKLPGICQSTIPNEDLSINNIKKTLNEIQTILKLTLFQTIILNFKKHRRTINISHNDQFSNFSN